MTTTKEEKVLLGLNPTIDLPGGAIEVRNGNFGGVFHKDEQPFAVTPDEAVALKRMGFFEDYDEKRHGAKKTTAATTATKAKPASETTQAQS